jgi:hypothetical protein
MNLSCERVRDVLWPLDRPRSYRPEEEMAREHVADCRECRAFFLRDAKLTQLLRRIGNGIDVPPSPRLRAAVAEALTVHARGQRPAAGASHPPESPGRQVSGGRKGWRAVRKVDVAAAAAALILLASGHLLADRYDEIKQSEKFATDYLRTAVVQASPPGFDTEEVGRFYERELGLRIVPVALHDAPVTRATVCDLRGDLGSMVEYDLAGTRLVHYRIPLDVRPVSAATPVAVDSRRGVQVARWTDAKFENALVSRAPAEYVRWLAENRFTRPAVVTNYGSPASRSWRWSSD